MKTGDRLRISLTGSETVVRVEGTQNLMHVHIQLDAQQGLGSSKGLSVEGSCMW